MTDNLLKFYFFYNNYNSLYVFHDKINMYRQQISTTAEAFIKLCEESGTKIRYIPCNIINEPGVKEAYQMHLDRCSREFQYDLDKYVKNCKKGDSVYTSLPDKFKKNPEAEKAYIYFIDTRLVPKFIYDMNKAYFENGNILNIPSYLCGNAEVIRQRDKLKKHATDKILFNRVKTTLTMAILMLILFQLFTFI